MPNGRTSRASLHVPLNHFARFHLWNMMLIPFLSIAKWPVFLCNSVAKKTYTFAFRNQNKEIWHTKHIAMNMAEAK